MFDRYKDDILKHCDQFNEPTQEKKDMRYQKVDGIELNVYDIETQNEIQKVTTFLTTYLLI